MTCQAAVTALSHSIVVAQLREHVFVRGVASRVVESPWLSGRRGQLVSSPGGIVVGHNTNRVCQTKHANWGVCEQCPGAPKSVHEAGADAGRDVGVGVRWSTIRLGEPGVCAMTRACRKLNRRSALGLVR